MSLCLERKQSYNQKVSGRGGGIVWERTPYGENVLILAFEDYLHA